MAKLLLLIDTSYQAPIEIFPTNEEWCDEMFLPELIGGDRLIRNNDVIKDVKIDLRKIEYSTYESGVMRKILFSDGRIIKFNLWGKGKVTSDSITEKWNIYASIIRNPHIRKTSRDKIYGKCLFEPYDETPLKSGDWKFIYEALFSNNEALIEKNCKANGIRTKNSDWSENK